MKIKTLLTGFAVFGCLALRAPSAPPGPDWKVAFDQEFTQMPDICSVSGKAVPGFLPCDSWNSHFYNSDQHYYCFPGVDIGFNPFTITTGSEGVDVLNITVDQAPKNMETKGHIYVSGCLSTAAGSDYGSDLQSSTPFGQTYGYFEIRAKLPTGQGPGFWPAFWLMPYNPGHPDANGTTAEYDIMEVLGGAPTIINQTVHWNKYAKQTSVAYKGPDTSAAFHTYGFEWDATNIRWYVDDVLTNTQPNVYNDPMYVILSVGIGGKGSWSGPATAATVFPGAYQIEYLRVYSGGTVAPPPTPVAAATEGCVDADIGKPAHSGSESVQGNAITVKGGGSDIWSKHDQFNYYAKPLSGPAQSMVVRVDSVDATDPWAKGGLMFRNSNTPSSPFVALEAVPDRTVTLQWRDKDGSGASSLPRVGDSENPKWLKLEKKGNTFTASYAVTTAVPAATDWKLIHAHTTVFTGVNYLGGLAVTAHNNSRLGAGVFENFSVAAPAAVPVATP